MRKILWSIFSCLRFKLSKMKTSDCRFIKLYLCYGKRCSFSSCRLASSLCHHISTLLGLRWELRGREHLEKNRACIIVANHQSSLDILGMFDLWPVMDKCTVVAKKEIFYAWPVGLAAWLCGLIFIDRMNSEKARSALNTATKEITDKKVKEGRAWIVLITVRFLLYFSSRRFADQAVDIPRGHQAQHRWDSSVQEGCLPRCDQVTVTHTTGRILLLLFLALFQFLLVILLFNY